MAVSSSTHSSLIQGISQQADISRGTASAADQENCLNEVLDGAVSRMGSVVISSFNASYSDPFTHEIIRSETEKYLVVIEAGSLRIFNRVTGVEATISGSISSYLAQSGSARRSFQAVTVGDTTFLLNRTKVVGMGTAKSAQRLNQACLYFRAGGYALTYTLSLIVNGTTYVCSYTTPDNSTSANAAFIATDHLAKEFSDVLNSTVFPAIAADGHGTFVSNRYGSTIVITAPGGVDLDIRTADGVGDTHMKAFTDSVKTIADLPTKCKGDYQVSVSPHGGANDERYYLKYVGGTDIGRWQEVVAPDVVLGVNAATMPHILVNTGLNAFTVQAASWGSRVSGDGEYTSVDPSFIGYPIRSIQFISGRLAAVSEFNMSLSRSRNAYVFFPDTAQTNLKTDPIDYDISNGSSTLIEYAVVAGGKLQFWGDGQQTYLDSGQDAIKEETTEVLPMANYEYDGNHPPKPIGMSSLVFGTTVGRWSKITEVFLRQGVPQGEIAITDHVPRLLDGLIRGIATGSATGKTFYLTENALKTAYLYQSYNQGQDRVQSAWNKWTFGAPSRILWAGIDRDTAYFLFQWVGKVTIEKVKLNAVGDEENERLPLRLDHRVSEAGAVFSGTYFTVTLPYPVPTDQQANFVCVEREDIPDVSQRGRELTLEWANGTTVRVLTNASTKKFYIGVIPVAKRRFSRFYARDRNDQPIIHDKLTVLSGKIAHKDTTEYDVNVYKRDGSVVRQTYEGRILGDQTITNADVPIKTGSFKFSVGCETEDAEIELVNKTPFGATWTAIQYVYELTQRAA